MKELSIEEKAERYDEAIIRAKKVLLDCTPEEQKVVEYITPELKESEDEKVRKGIIKSIMDLNTNWLELHGITKKNAIAWLEKQGKQKPVDFSDLRTWKYIVDAVLTEKEGIGQYLDSPFTEEVAKKLQKRFGNIEQKSAWSEEDEIKIKSITALLKSPALCAMDGNKGIIDESIKYLKSLKERVQPKVELTQLDKNILEAAIAFVELNNHFNCWRGVNRQTVLSALHSLEPQNTWKPSYEQMNKLCWIANQNKDNMIGKELMTLYNDLKKLREE